MYNNFFHILSLERIRPLTHVSGCPIRIPFHPTTLDLIVCLRNNQSKTLGSFLLPHIFSCFLTVTSEVETSHHPTNSCGPVFFFLRVFTLKFWHACIGPGGPNARASVGFVLWHLSSIVRYVEPDGAHWMRDSCQGLHARK